MKNVLKTYAFISLMVIVSVLFVPGLEEHIASEVLSLLGRSVR